jgi:predicted RNA-binding protein
MTGRNWADDRSEYLEPHFLPNAPNDYIPRSFILRDMCESSVFLEEHGEIREIMKDVSRIIVEGNDATCIDVVGEQMILQNVKLKEANLLSHGIVLARI